MCASVLDVAARGVYEDFTDPGTGVHIWIEIL